MRPSFASRLRLAALFLPTLGALAACVAPADGDVAATASAELSGRCGGRFEETSAVELPGARRVWNQNGADSLAFVSGVKGSASRRIVFVVPTRPDGRTASRTGEPMRLTLHEVPVGAGGVLGAPTVTTIDVPFTERIFAGDFDGDGLDDLGLLTADDLAGPFALHQILHEPSGAWGAPTPVVPTLCGALAHFYAPPRSVTVRDVDGDGRADVLANLRNDDAHRATVLLSGTPTGLDGGRCVAVTNGAARTEQGIDPRWRYQERLEQMAAFTLGDFDGDGKLDAVGTHYADEGFLFSDVLGAVRRAQFPIALRGVRVAARWDADGHDDLLDVLPGGLSVHPGRTPEPPGAFFGARTFVTPASSLPPGGATTYPTELVVADLNGDGRADAVQVSTFWGLRSGDVRTFPTLCSGGANEHVDAAPTFTTPETRALRVLAAAELDGIRGDELVVLAEGAGGAAPRLAVLRLDR